MDMSALKDMANQIKQIQGAGGNPTNILNMMFPNNPALSMANGGGLEGAIRSKCQQMGINFDEAYKMAQQAYNG